MRAALKGFAAVLLAVLFTGCATGPKFAEVSSSLSALAPDKGRIYLYRTAIFGAAVQPQVRINDEVVGKAVPNGFFFVDRPPGNYTIATTTEVERHLSMTLDAGQTRYVRLSLGIGFFVGHVYPELVENSVGAKEIQELSYVGQ